MNRYKNIEHMLKTVFNVDNGLSEDAAIRIYRRTAQSSGNAAALCQEIESALADQTFSWRQLLANDDYEVLATGSEEQARAYALSILLEPLQDG